MLKDLRWITWVIFAVWLSVVLAFYLLWGRRHYALNRTAAAATDSADPRAVG